MITLRSLHEKASCFTLGKQKLRKLKLQAVRCGVWFRGLSRVDRALVNLTIKVVDGVRSFTLAKALLSVIKKLEDAFESRVLRILKEVGFPLARKLSLFAQKWGNNLAQNWMRDVSFAKFLAIMHINSPGVFKV
jgi:hypothetical protein